MHINTIMLKGLGKAGGYEKHNAQVKLLVNKRLTRFFVFASLLLTSQSPLASGRIGHVLVSLWLGPCRLQKSGNQMYDVGYWSRYAQTYINGTPAKYS